ncbi:cytochrome P460 family protein [Roseovarius rhodophyticola]|uniref:Cytochrome P460 family protein n=1 Tax=Roseovarius rhodophyticola TaxID=3080827 RepID=A0ABZ2TBS3_9RHOB|nr:cytochrome P460 family protein [Roseovarius sp. W115]MDV2930888.1 cytochrome P460 family protein [Roseovarius sp. W115]
MIRKLAIAAAFMSFAGAASAEDCAAITVEDSFDLTDDHVTALYECLGAQMAEGYASQGDAIAAEYRNWTPTQTLGAVAGAHGKRVLFTYANDVAAEQYLKFEDEGVEMPVGSVLAKESISISIKKQKARPGPLFLMTKVGLDEAPDTKGWLYGGIQPNGKPMKVKQSFCHDCHIAWESQDALAYPVEEYRVSQ